MTAAAFDSLETLTADQVLAISLDSPEQLFSGDSGALDQEFRSLAKRWHPDRNPGTNTDHVFAHIQQLRDAARENLRRGVWRTPGLLQLTGIDGKAYRLKYRKQHSFELGEFYVGKTIVTFCVKPEFKDLYDQALATLKKFPYANDVMQAEISRFLPTVMASFATTDRLVLVTAKNPDFVLLGDLQAQQKGKLAPAHTAWVISRLSNISSYLQFAKLTHNAIGPDTVFVSPATHQAALLGGWWYSVPAGQGLTALPNRALALASPDILTAKKADPRLDLELIRATGRELMGDPIGYQLRADKTVPDAFSEWLMRSPSGTALENYRHWQQTVLPQSFGPRRFIKLNVGFEDVYPQP
jgi:hypothetical protein